MYPPTVKEVGAEMHYPPHVPDSHRFAVGHEAFGLVPGLMMYATIWLREHNRVCDVLKEVHPDWDDERLFQTSRLILIGKFLRFWQLHKTFSVMQLVKKNPSQNDNIKACHAFVTALIKSPWEFLMEEVIVFILVIILVADNGGFRLYCAKQDLLKDVRKRK